MARAARRRNAKDSSPAARLLEGAALACILAAVVARPFANEMAFRWPELVFAQGASLEGRPPSNELTRVSFAMILLAAAGLWAVAQVFRRRLQVGGLTFALMVVLFGGWSLLSALGAVDRRGGLDGWLEQLSILLAAFVVMQLAREGRRRGLVVAVLAALGFAMAWKAVHQVLWEVPERISAFEEDPDKAFQAEGIDPLSPKAEMFKKRLHDWSATGYLGLANVFASLLVVLAAAAAGLAIEKVARAIRERKTGPPLPRGEIHLPTLAGGIGLLLAGAVVLSLALTRSKGGFAAAAVAFMGGAALIPAWGFFARHRRKFLLAGAAALLAGIIAVSAYGKARGSLPGRSLQVRWEYWVGAARVIRESPLRGVGPGNFGNAYLRHRLPAAAENTKSAHNVLLDAACSYGLPGGALYLALLVWVFLGVARPAADDKPHAPATPGRHNRSTVLWCVFLAAVVMVIRSIWLGTTKPSVLFLDAALPGVVFGVALLAAMWSGGALGSADLCGRLARIALGCGLVGFALHNLMTYTLWSPATATVFWVAAAAVAAPGLPPRDLPRARAVSLGLAGLVVVGVVLSGVILWRPVHLRTSHLRAAQSAYARRQGRSAAARLKLAIDADELDGLAPGHLAMMYLPADPTAATPAARQAAARALPVAELAYRRSPGPMQAILLARTLWLCREDAPRALAMFARVLELDPMDVRLRWEYAGMLFETGRFDAAAEQVREIHRIDHARPADSDLRLTSDELEKLKLLENRIEELRRRAAG